MDVAIVTRKPNDRYGLIVLKGSVFKKGTWENVTIDDKTALFVDDGNITTQPMLLDINGDMISDLLVSEIDEDGKSSYFVYLGGSFERRPFHSLNQNFKAKKSNSNAFIDLNHDGVSDIFLEGTV